MKEKRNDTKRATPPASSGRQDKLRTRRVGEQQEQAFIHVVLCMGEFPRCYDKEVRDSRRLVVDGIDTNMATVPGLGKLDVETSAWIGGVVGSGAVFVGTGAGVTAAATSFGVAGTGAAIAGLSGAAAEGAALAFLGGGSLAAGGGGMASVPRR